jgi:hypothetical protein
MHLWTEYEGRTIAGAYTLGKLLRSEGRNGFFATSDTTGNSAVIRLTEAHYDEEELLKRWRQVAGMHQENLIEIERVGRTDFDGVPVTYALMEPNDANLADVLKERPLTTTETLEVARSVGSALGALHASGLVHEHIEPANVLAVDEVVKLRSDCVRECVADIEFNTPEGCEELRRRDVHDFGMLLLECLTLEKRLGPSMRLPMPFDRVIPGAIQGALTLKQIRTLLEPRGGSAAAALGQAAAAQPARARPAAKQGARSEAAQQTSLNLTPGLDAGALLDSDAEQDERREAKLDAVTGFRSRRDRAEEAQAFSLRPVWVLCAVSAVFAVLVLWHVLAGKPAKRAATQVAKPVATAPSQPVHAAAARMPALGAAEISPTPASAAHASGWYVIAYTYNHSGQAQGKADRLNAGHSGLHAEVFSPRGGAPFLVSLGGPMSKAEAAALERRAHRAGMPRDTYIRNYR